MDLSIQVQDRQKVIRIVGSLLRDRAKKTGESLRRLLQPYLPADKEMPDIELLLLMLVALIEDTQKQLEESDVAHARELADDAAPRKNRDDATAAVYEKIVSIRNGVFAVYGEGGIKALGMSGPTPQEPALLERFARDVAERLGDARISLGDPVNPDVAYNRQTASVALLALCDTLKGYIAQVDQETAEAKQTQHARAEKLAAWQKTVPAACAAGRGILLVAGDEEGAALLVSTPPRRAKSKSEEEAQQNTPQGAQQNTQGAPGSSSQSASQGSSQGGEPPKTGE